MKEYKAEENLWKMCVSCNQLSTKEDLLRQQKQNGKTWVLLEINRDFISAFKTLVCTKRNKTPM